MPVLSLDDRSPRYKRGEPVPSRVVVGVFFNGAASITVCSGTREFRVTLDNEDVQALRTFLNEA
jgi:hypothetical protein